MFDLSIKIDMVKSSKQIYKFQLNRRNILMRIAVSNPFYLFLHIFMLYFFEKQMSKVAKSYRSTVALTIPPCFYFNTQVNDISQLPVKTLFYTVYLPCNLRIIIIFYNLLSINYNKMQKSADFKLFLSF